MKNFLSSKTKYLPIYGNTLFAMFIFSIIGLLIWPIPSSVLDLFFSISMSLSIIILLNVLFIQTSLDFSSFPSVLLISTLLRLALNIASTRLILSRGHIGAFAAGHIIETFGKFVMQGSIVIGIIVFAIITIINFVVITKGSERIAEVSARFSLDAMPGKQMAIDADLSSGLINDKIAQDRRRKLEEESSFFGSMDGASKFVRGDAIAGLLITFINFIGGILIGLFQQKITLEKALKSYTILTIGDGLIGQVPALIVSIAAGLLVTKSNTDQSTDQQILGQIISKPEILLVAMGLLMLIGFMPGMPMKTFLFMEILFGTVYYVSVFLPKKGKDDVMVEPLQEKRDIIADALNIDDMRIEFGNNLVSLATALDENIINFRVKIASELGFLVPYIRMIDNNRVNVDEYKIFIKDTEVGKGTLFLNKFMVLNKEEGEILINGTKAKDPSFGIDVKWVDLSQKNLCLEKNYSVIEPKVVLITHITELIKNNIGLFVNYAMVQTLLQSVSQEYKRLIEETVPAKVSIYTIKQVMQRLLEDEISIKNLPAIIELIAEASEKNTDIEYIVESVRLGLSFAFVSKLKNNDGKLHCIYLSSQWNNFFSELQTNNQAIPPSKINDFIKMLKDQMKLFESTNSNIPIIVADGIRSYLNKFLKQFNIKVHVLSQKEIQQNSDSLKILTQI